MERSRPVVSIAPPGSGPPVYLRELEPSFRFHYMTSAGEVYRETPTGFELVRSIDLGAPVAAAELGADLGRDLLAVSALGRLHEIRDGTVCPPVPLDVRPDGGFEGFREAVFVTGTDLSSGERVIQRVRSSEP